MKAPKFQLRLDDLEVESFDTTPLKEGSKEGTVYGMDSSPTAACTCLGTCTCPSDCSCPATCGGTCGNSCEGTCETGKIYCAVC